MSDSSADPDDVLVETLPASWVSSSWRHYILLIGGPTAIVCGCVAIGIGYQSGWMSACLAFLILGPIPAFLVFGTAIGLRDSLRTQIPTVELRSGRLTVRYGKHTLAADIKDCHVHRGRAYKMHLLGDIKRLQGGVKVYNFAQVILIDLPPLWAPSRLLGVRFIPRNRVAVGYSDETREQWEGAILACLERTTFATRPKYGGQVGSWDSDCLESTVIREPFRWRVILSYICLAGAVVFFCAADFTLIAGILQDGEAGTDPRVRTPLIVTSLVMFVVSAFLFWLRRTFHPQFCDTVESRDEIILHQHKPAP